MDAPKIAIDGFLKSNNLVRENIFEKQTEKGNFFFAKIEPKILDIKEELTKLIPDILKKHSWKKSMRWSDYNLNWGRPLKSILALFGKEVIRFSFFHLQSSNITYSEEVVEEKEKVIKSFKSYLNLLDSKKIILDHQARKNIIKQKIEKICKSRKLKSKLNDNLLEEVVNLVEKPNVIVGKFEKSFLDIPKEI